MSEEVESTVVEQTPVPAQEVTATPAADVASPEEKQAEAPKTFTQEELDAIVSKRLAREQRKWERDHVPRQPEPQARTTETLRIDQFESPEAYAEALAERKAEERIARQSAEAARSETLDAYHDREEEVRAKYDDFEQVAYNPKLRITNVMAEAIQSSDIGPEVAYYLGTNPKEADRISRLAPVVQAREIGRIEAKLAADPPAKKTTRAPDPIAPVTARASNGAQVYDTTDPRSIKSMSTSEWIEAERARQAKKYAARTH